MQFRSSYFLIFFVSLLCLEGCHDRGGIIHNAGRDDSLNHIAHLYGVDILDLLKANPKLNDNHIKPGQKVFIPGAKEVRYLEKSIWDFEEPWEPKTGAGPLTEEVLVVPKSREKDRRFVKEDVREDKAFNFSWPARGEVVSFFGMKNRKMHNGIDIRVRPGADISAAADGKIVYQGRGIEGYGNMIILKHTSKLFSIYAYLGPMLGQRGNEVRKGDIIAKANIKTQESFLHFEIRKGKAALNPTKILSK